MVRLWAALALGGMGTGQAAPPQDGLARALTFHASFDGQADADFAPGGKAVSFAAGGKVADAKPGLPEGVVLAKGGGRYGDALRWTRKIKEVVFYKADGNVKYAPDAFQGTVSFWLSLDPEKDLEPNTYCDPIQLTDKKWDDSCFFVDFHKDGNPRHFRLGVFSHVKEWNPDGKKFDAIPYKERPWVIVDKHPFAKGRWTHVCFTWEKFNSGGDDGVASLYLDGALQGALRGKRTFTWDPAKAAILLGFNYTGLFDDLSVFDRALSAEEVRTLGALDGGAKSLGRK
jgi:hypothetical protein